MSRSDEGVPVCGAKNVCEADKRVPVSGGKGVARKGDGEVLLFHLNVSRIFLSW